MFLTAALGLVAGAIIGGVIAAATGKNILAGALIGAAIGGLIGITLGAAAGVLLTSSAMASTAAVMTGGSALIATVGGGGLLAGGKMIADNISKAVNSGGGQAVTQTASKTFYQVTSKETSEQIAQAGKLIPKEFNSVYVLNIQPTLSQAQNLECVDYIEEPFKRIISIESRKNRCQAITANTPRK